MRLPFFGIIEDDIPLIHNTFTVSRMHNNYMDLSKENVSLRLETVK
jgi:hypothetical protein